MVALGRREGCQNDPQELLHNPPRGERPKNFPFLRKSRFYDVFGAGGFPLVFISTENVVKQLFLSEGCFIFVTTSGNTNVDNMVKGI